MCYRCHQKGHYKNECKEELPVEEKKKTGTPAQEKQPSQSLQTWSVVQSGDSGGMVMPALEGVCWK